MTSSPYSRFSGFASGRAAPVSPDRQQGPLSPPPSQQQAPQYNQAAAKQFGSSQAGGDYSVYGQQSGYPQGGYKNYAQPVGQTIPYQQPRQTFYGTPEAHYPGFPSSQPSQPLVVQDPSGIQRQIDDLKRRGTWDDPRNAKARQRLEQNLQDINAAPPGYFKTPDGRFEPNYGVGIMRDVNAAPQQTPIYGGGPGADGQSFYQPGDFGRRVRLAQDPRPVQQPYNNPPPQQPYYGTPESHYPGFASGSQPQVFNLPAMDQGPQFYNQRDAFINNINQSLGQQMMQNFGSSRPIPPQLDFGALWGQAGEMARNGWTNPLAGLFA